MIINEIFSKTLARNCYKMFGLPNLRYVKKKMYEFSTIRSCETLFLLIRDIMKMNLLINLMRSNQIKVFKKKKESNKVKLK